MSRALLERWQVHPHNAGGRYNAGRDIGPPGRALLTVHGAFEADGHGVRPTSMGVDAEDLCKVVAALPELLEVARRLSSACWQHPNRRGGVSWAMDRNRIRGAALQAHEVLSRLDSVTREAGSDESAQGDRSSS